MTAENVTSLALSLSRNERAELATALLATLHGEPDAGVDAAWDAEVERRWAEVERGEAVGHNWQEVRARGRRAAA